ncbi:MAG: Aminomethyltransferase [Firmicutes bacterium ADurb.Bin506]|jgi:aminomethyltransferase|nr:MAG: Aminomethyltransferase [Firmicutes bacterium ADurb.Bin506]
MSDLRKTPLYDAHVAAHGRIIDFGGWALPVQYSGILEEHRAVRERAGLFDVSHMGEILITGPGANAAINRLITNDCSAIAVHQVMYSPMCYPGGGVVDDILIYRINESDYWLVVNASNTAKDFEWITSNITDPNVKATNLSDTVAQLAIQGPLAQSVLARICDADLDLIKFYWCRPDVTVAGCKCMVSRTGYTGEDGFEIYCDPKDAIHVWNSLLEAGAADGLVPAGLGARDTLRFEAGMPLYGHELSPEISPLEAGLGYFVKLDAGDFIGRDALAKQKASGVSRRVVGLDITGRGVAREHFNVLTPNGEAAGFVTSGVFSPTLNRALAMALVDIAYAKAGTELAIDIRGKAVPATVIKTPFYKKAYRKE